METKSGFLLINKPSGPTSFDMVYKLRKLTGIKKIGHAGTLDPFATGLLILAIRREATREIGKFMKKDKKYVAKVRLGATTSTYDRMGELKVTEGVKEPTLEQIKDSLKRFTGKLEQIPPMFSAKKVAGRKLYDLARAGQTIERQPSQVEVFSINLKEYAYPDLTIEVHCGSGTYIRSLAHDLGEALGCGAYLEELERTSIGEYELKDAHQVNELGVDWEKFLF